MKANIYLEPLKPKFKTLHPTGSSYFMGCLERANMKLPRVFNAEDIPILRGLAACFENKHNPYNELIAEIIENGEINVWYEY